MPFTPDQEKKELRRQVRAQLAALEAEQLRREDDAMFARFLALPQVEQANTIFAFWGIPGREPETGRLVQELTARCHASFVIDTLEFLYKGGRCSALAMLGANLLQLKPCIEVNPADGSMNVGKKYRGSLDKALSQYVRDKLEGCADLKTDRVFITHSGISQERIDMVRDLVKQYADFKEIYVTRAGCTISSHCGPNTLGVLFLQK